MNRPRSGIAPPEVTASRWAPGRDGERARIAVVHEPRAQLGELSRRVLARKQIQRRLVCTARQRRERRAPSYRVEPEVGVQRFQRAAATVCWASTSSGFVGTRMVSISPDSIRSSSPIRSLLDRLNPPRDRR